MSETKSTREVFESHLKLRLDKEVESDIHENFSPEVVLLTSDGQFAGHDGVRQSASLLQDRIPDGQYHYEIKMVHDTTAFLVWSASRNGQTVCRGADSFVVKDGKIVIQTIYYSMNSE